MSDHQSNRIVELFHNALEHSPEKRAAFLEDACGGDSELLGKIRRLIENAGADTGEVFASASNEHPPRLPNSLNTRYEQLQLLGEGGMGVVYRARDRELGKLVALKMLKPAYAQDPQMVERFRNEICLGQEITHKNVCRTYGLERFDDVTFISMEYVEGQTLRKILDGVKGVSIPQGLSWAREICGAITAAHEKKVVHRDLKPENIMIAQDGHVKVMDFGIARSIQSIEVATGTRIGTPEYMSPEQLQNGAVGPGNDIYSLGVVLYEMFTGVKYGRSAPAPNEANPYLPSQIDHVIRKCLQTSAIDRFQSADELLTCLANTQPHDQALLSNRRTLILALTILIAAVSIGSFSKTEKPVEAQHDGRVDALAFSPDGRVLASGSEDQTIKIWALPGMRTLHTLVGHERAVTTLAFSGDGKWLASGSQDKSIRLWEVGTGRLISTLSADVDLTVVALSLDGRWLASSGNEKIRIWDVQKGQVVHSLAHKALVRALVFSPDGRFVASGSNDETARVWDVETGQPVGVPLSHNDVVKAVAFSPDGRFVASFSLDKTIKIWSLASWMTIQTLFLDKAEVSALSFNFNGSLLMSVDVEDKVELWEAPTWKKVAAYTVEEPDTVQCWVFSRDGRTLAAGTTVGTVTLHAVRLR